MMCVIPCEIREEDVFFKFLPAHRHPIAGSRTSPMKEVGIKIVPHLIDVRLAESILQKMNALVASPLSVHSVALILCIG
jgi:hypothetical protein